jgi:hypothetical protein
MSISRTDNPTHLTRPTSPPRGGGRPRVTHRSTPAATLFALCDTDGSGEISFDEFAAWWAERAYQTTGSVGEQLMTEIQVRWDEADADRSGALTQPEFGTVLERLATSEWEQVVDPNTGKPYYYHRGTNETRWSAPEGDSAVRQFLKRYGVEVGRGRPGSATGPSLLGPAQSSQRRAPQESFEQDSPSSRQIIDSSQDRSKLMKASQGGSAAKRCPLSLEEIRSLSTHKKMVLAGGVLGVILVSVVFLVAFLNAATSDACPAPKPVTAQCMDKYSETISSDVRPAVDIVVVLDTAGDQLEKIKVAAVNKKLDERLKASNAKTNEPIVISLIWDTTHDLDLHCKPPGRPTINYNNRKDSVIGAELDVDNTVGGSGSVENLFFRKPSNGNYKCSVTSFTGGVTEFTARLTKDDGTKK